MTFSKRTSPRKSLKLNLIFNSVYQVLILIVPLITTPYISSVFTSDIIGSYSYAFSIVQYFTLATAFGFTTYGTNAVAHSQNKAEKKKTFWGIYYTKGILDILLLSLYFTLVLTNSFSSTNYPLNDFKIYIVFSLPILANTVDATFLLASEEKFVSLCVRNIIIKTLSTLCIFLFVKEPSDYTIYVLFIALSYFLTGFATTISIPFVVGKPCKIPFKDLSIHFKGSFIFFLPSISTTIYSIVSKTILGVVNGDSSQSGFFEQANKIVDIVVAIVNSLGTIMMSRMSSLYAQGKFKEIEKKTRKSLEVYCIMAFPCFLGLVAINDYFTLGFLGQNFAETIPLIYILALKILFTPLSELIGSIYYIPANKIKKRTLYVLSGLAFNIVSSIILIYFFASKGAALSSALASIFLTICFVMGAKKHLNFAIFKKEGILCLDAALIMVCIIFLIKPLALASAFTLFGTILSERFCYLIASLCLILLGAITYGLILILFKEPLIKEVLNSLIVKLKSFVNRKNKNS